MSAEKASPTEFEMAGQLIKGEVFALPIKAGAGGSEAASLRSATGVGEGIFGVAALRVSVSGTTMAPSLRPPSLSRGFLDRPHGDPPTEVGGGSAKVEAAAPTGAGDGGHRPSTT